MELTDEARIAEDAEARHDDDAPSTDSHNNNVTCPENPLSRSATREPNRIISDKSRRTKDGREPVQPAERGWLAGWLAGWPFVPLMLAASADGVIEEGGVQRPGTGNSRSAP
ncbi:unnamed protein product [Heligmosomoides polygyrus]|uniref:Uncharacterized protein n=1 Tax=Heligmosomoides polygyrus TaxID=6339 RepID=A0A183GKZ3_HELPZ|nr:unnamed protein product [Heligmosomoides polygyrus]